jgi:arginyl-tRNA synthetase
MLFDPKESLSFNGNTGPYLQYMGARISSMLRKKLLEKDLTRGHGGTGEESNAEFSLRVSDPEWELVKVLAEYPFAVIAAADNLDPSHLAAYLYELSKAFSRFYHECPILNCEDKALSDARLELSRAVMLVLKDAFNLICIPFLEVM